MIEEREITATLQKLDVLHSTTADVDMLNLYSKLSMLEFCGWIETTMDSIILSFTDRELSNNYKQEFKKFVKDTHGFLYHGHFRILLYKAIGLYNLEKLETKINHNIITLNTELELLWALRGELAHTYTDSMKNYKVTPSTILNGSFKKIHPILRLIQDEMNALP